MSAEPFTYARYEETRAQLIRAVNDGLSEADRAFLLSVKAVEPDWSIYDFERFPAVQWKLLNLERLKDRDPEKHRRQYEELKKRLGIS